MKNLISFASVVYLSFFPSIPDGIEAAVDQEIQTRVLRHLHIIPLKTFFASALLLYSFGSALLMVFLWLCTAHGIPLALPCSVLWIRILFFRIRIQSLPLETYTDPDS
jgi:hypothetical protein